MKGQYNDYLTTEERNRVNEENRRKVNDRCPISSGTKCPRCGLTLADPPNGEEECVGPEATSPAIWVPQLALPTLPQPTTPPYRAEVIDNAVLALSGGVKL